MTYRSVAVLAVALCVPVPSEAARTCEASWYGGGEALAERTASGEVFRPDRRTAAHWTLPFGTLVRVSSGARTVIVRINDRGPHPKTGRCIDLSKASARHLGMIRAGTAQVRLTVIN